MKAPNANELLRTEQLTLHFGGIAAADGIDFVLAHGEQLAVIGANGAGKTTFINICTGYIKPSSGRVLLEGQDITRKGPRQIARLGVGRSFQLPQLFLDHTVRQCLELASVSRQGRLSRWTSLSRAADQRAVAEMLELVGLARHANDATAALPEGRRKLLDVGIALMLEPKLVIMDEPTSGVSSEDKHDVMQTLMHALQQCKVTSWFVEHDVDIVRRYATRVAAWIDGRIAADGTPAQVFADPLVRREVLGER
ncbi:Energy-coupling factor transporter ATP-binding protein EcfA3 [Variovorax sp. PBS-H4]|uniref:ABC transporter ATP-binding protein n=1 Tax=Variovorax sp. PBS-H4 TaxID=434008 RepID=UPI0013167FA7|nr:ATP-binding cassette domain-containing protein [Variovorax sp. PBS-H4]VTU39012.1 Energy-coupling factor transporter ATP-binding protein EcfA3 [Variovorax sp. PBS-H4]